MSKQKQVLLLNAGIKWMSRVFVIVWVLKKIDVIGLCFQLCPTRKSLRYA
jgi:hypothetical protein